MYIEKSLCELIESEQYNISLGITLDKKTLNNFPVKLTIEFQDLSTFDSEDIVSLKNEKLDQFTE